MNREIDLLSSLPKPKRDVKVRASGKTPEVIKTAKKFGQEYFDGDRKYGYGGFKYDGRWLPVAKDILNFFKINKYARILDIGCAKGFLVKDLMSIKMLDVRGIDISQYAIDNCLPEIAHRLQVGTAEKLPFSDKSFDLVISINTLHNLPRDKCIKALKEIERVGKQAYIVIDSYYTPDQKEEFENWQLTAETHGYPSEWSGIFEESGYTGFYGFNVL